MRALIIAVLLCLLPCLASAAPAAPADSQRAARPTGAAYQWALTVTKPDGSTITACLWVPPKCPRIRGVILGGDPSLASIAEDPAIRAAAAAEDLAIIGFKPHLDSIFNYKEGDGPETFQKVLDAAAAASGYPEIAVAPFFTFGHSVSCNYATAAACWQPGRCFGVLVFKGGLVMPAYDPQASIAGVPVLAIKGQYEEFGPGPSGVLRDFEDRETGWKKSRESYLKLREADERNLISLLVEAGTTHMDWSERDGQYVALFVRKAAQARIPDWPADAEEPVKCKEIDVASGALTSTAVTNPDAARAAPYAQFKGNKKAAYWHVDLELARAFDAFHEGRFNKRAQFVTFAAPDTGQPLYSRHDLRFDARVAYTGPDAFKVAATFLMTARDRYPVPEPPVGHAEGSDLRVMRVLLA